MVLDALATECPRSLLPTVSEDIVRDGITGRIVEAADFLNSRCRPRPDEAEMRLPRAPCSQTKLDSVFEVVYAGYETGAPGLTLNLRTTIEVSVC